MFKKYFSVPHALLEITEDVKKFSDTLPGFATRFASQSRPMQAVRLDPNRFLYVRTAAVHAEESAGPNQNWDGMPRIELQTNFHTFIGKRISVDHSENPLDHIGFVLDSEFVPLKIEGNRKEGDCIQNVWAVDKTKADRHDKDLIPDVLAGVITDTSMGADVQYTVCSIPGCRNVAYNPDEYCTHIATGKGRLFVVGSLKVVAYESCFGVRFFEDSLIKPKEKGGRAGGRGADAQAKVMERIASQIKLPKEEIMLAVNRVCAALPQERLKDMDLIADLVMLTLKGR